MSALEFSISKINLLRGIKIYAARINADVMLACEIDEINEEFNAMVLATMREFNENIKP